MIVHTFTTPKHGLGALLSVVVLLLCSLPQHLSASECGNPVAQAVSIQGRVEAIAEDASQWQPLHQNDRLCPGDRVRVGAGSRAALTLNDETLLRLAENSSVRISAPGEDGSAWLDLLEGIAHFISRVSNRFQVNTPYVNASIEGTEFTVDSRDDHATITVLEGRVRASNAHGEVVVADGQQALAAAEQAPRVSAVVDPLDAVQWALYYPPVIEPPPEDLSADIRDSLEAYRRNDMKAAFAALDQASGIEADPDLLAYRASLHLRVGVIAAAQRDLDAALRLQPEHPGALAVMSVIATVRNERQQALDLAQRAIAADPQASPPLLALSYARQARFQLPEALEAAEKATEVAPDSHLAWSRLAQMQLMFRRLDAASEAANRALELAPDQPQTLATLGFAQLIRFKMDSARQSFERSAALDQAAPLPRLGLGLVEIRQGNLQAGRRQLEIAANMDPGNALIRSYLGKAYYEEKRSERAATQFALAKRFDELDPTAWFYGAILKQSQNRPVEAMRELQTSIDLNDNRAVYRSRLLLDQDEAARNASQARIYQDLGFEQLARAEAYKSLQTSPQTHSAHRLLSDSYTGEPRYERARMSELLQSQLLQPLNATPIQPQLATSRLGILDGAGPTAGGFSEYTPLFTRNGLDAQFNAIGGNNQTAGDDLILSGLKDRIAFSLGQFHYETDGWRENNDLKQDIYNAFLQVALSPSTSIQFEYRYQEADYGYLDFAFDADLFNSIERNDLERSVGRIGLHHQFSPNSHLIASAIYQDMLRKRTWIETIEAPFGTITDSKVSTNDSISRALELQLIQRIHDHTFTFGGGYYDENYSARFVQELEITPPPPFPLPPVPSPTLDEIDPKFKNAYLYSLLTLPARFSMTLGLAYEDFENFTIETDQLSPKFGLTWDALENLVFRAAYLESLARPEQLEQTVEQTQVAGFNQRFDDVAASEIKHFGLGVDAKLGRNLSGGAEINRRDLQAPHTGSGSGNVVYKGQDEIRSSAYLYWTATNRLGVRIAYEKEDYESTGTLETLTTQRTPIGFSYHWPWGLALQAEGTYIDQEITRSGVTDQTHFWNLDGVLGYRFPKRYGKIELIVKNILDKEFNYYDLSFHSGEPLMPQFQPERQVFARFTLNF